MLPSGWKKYLLGNIATFRNGLNFTKSDAGEKIKMVGVADFKNRSKLEKNYELDSIKVATKVRDADLLKSGDLLFVRSNGNKELIGRCLYFPHVTDRISFSGFTIRGRVDTSVIEPEFASYLMRSKIVTDQIFLGGSGTNISNLSQEILSKVEVKIPDLTEQRRIANILFTWDQAIATTERLIEKSQKQKLSLKKILLSGKRRFSNPRGPWGYEDIGVIFERVRCKNTTGNINVLTISGERGLINQRDYFNKSVASTNLAGYTLIDRGDFAYNKSYSAGYPMGAIKPLLEYDSGVVSSLYICFRLRKEVDASLDFFRHYFEAGFLNQEIEGIAQEGARNHGLLNVGVTDFFKLRLHVPDGAEQRDIAEVINVAEAEELHFKRHLQTLLIERQALMQQLFTGKRRVHLIDAKMAAQV